MHSDEVSESFGQYSMLAHCGLLGQASVVACFDANMLYYESLKPPTLDPKQPPNPGAVIVEAR